MVLLIWRQKEGKKCLSQLAYLYDYMGGWSMDAVHKLTVDNEENTHMFLRNGGLVPWLSDDSKVLLPDPLPTYFGNKKSKRKLKVKKDKDKDEAVGSAMAGKPGQGLGEASEMMLKMKGKAK